MLHSARALRSYCARGILSPWLKEKKERKIPRRGMLRITRRNLLVCGANARGTRIRARRLLTPEKTEGLRAADTGVIDEIFHALGKRMRPPPFVVGGRLGVFRQRQKRGDKNGPCQVGIGQQHLVPFVSFEILRISNG